MFPIVQDLFHGASSEAPGNHVQEGDADFSDVLVAAIDQTAVGPGHPAQPRSLNGLEHLLGFLALEAESEISDLEGGRAESADQPNSAERPGPVNQHGAEVSGSSRTAGSTGTALDSGAPTVVGDASRTAVDSDTPTRVAHASRTAVDSDAPIVGLEGEGLVDPNTFGGATGDAETTTASVEAADLSSNVASVDTIDRSMEHLHPTLRSKVGRVIERMRSEHGHEVELMEGYRTPERQEHLYAQGRTRPGPVVTWTRDSRHAQGRAADLRVDGGSSDPSAYERLQRVAQEEGLRTLGMKDPGHVELAPQGGWNSRGVAVVARVARVAEVARPRPARPGFVTKPSHANSAVLASNAILFSDGPAVDNTETAGSDARVPRAPAMADMSGIRSMSTLPT